jgi:hypothetical protein
MINDSLLLGGICALLMILGFWQGKHDEFDLRWLIVDTKTHRVSLFKLGQLVALLTSTWALVYQTRHDHLTEWLFTAYMIAWAGANVANKFVDRKPPEIK